MIVEHGVQAVGAILVRYSPVEKIMNRHDSLIGHFDFGNLQRIDCHCVVSKAGDFCTLPMLVVICSMASLALCGPSEVSNKKGVPPPPPNE